MVDTARFALHRTLAGLVLGIGATVFLGARSAEAKTFQIDPGGALHKTFNTPKPIGYRVGNFGDCPVLFVMRDPNGNFLLQVQLDPGQHLKWIGDPATLIGSCNAFAVGSATIGVILVVKSFVGRENYDLPCLAQSTIVYEQHFTCPPTASPPTVIENTGGDGDCQIEVIATTQPDTNENGQWEQNELQDVLLHELDPGERTPIMASAVRYYKVKCRSSGARCKFVVR